MVIRRRQKRLATVYCGYNSRLTVQLFAHTHTYIYTADASCDFRRNRVRFLYFFFFFHSKIVSRLRRFAKGMILLEREFDLIPSKELWRITLHAIRDLSRDIDEMVIIDRCTEIFLIPNNL